MSAVIAITYDGPLYAQHDAQSIPTPTAKQLPFWFLDLPHEVRDLVYQSYFAGCRILIGIQRGA